MSGFNFWLECPTKVRSTQLSYIFKALFRDTPLAYNFFRATCHMDTWPPGHLPPGTWNANTIGKWDVPEKSFENVAQLCWPYLRRAPHTKVKAVNNFLGIRLLYFTLQMSEVQFQHKERYLSKTSFLTYSCIDTCNTIFFKIPKFSFSEPAYWTLRSSALLCRDHLFFNGRAQFLLKAAAEAPGPITSNLPVLGEFLAKK